MNYKLACVCSTKKSVYSVYYSIRKIFNFKHLLSMFIRNMYRYTCARVGDVRGNVKNRLALISELTQMNKANDIAIVATCRQNRFLITKIIF